MKNMMDERDALKFDIEEQMSDGVQFDYGDQMLIWEYGHTDSFEWERMVKDGLVTLEQARPYLKSTPFRKLVSRAKNPKKGPSNEDKFKAQAIGPDLLEVVEKFLKGEGDLADIHTVVARVKEN